MNLLRVKLVRASLGGEIWNAFNLALFGGYSLISPARPTRLGLLQAVIDASPVSSILLITLGVLHGLAIVFPPVYKALAIRKYISALSVAFWSLLIMQLWQVGSPILALSLTVNLFLLSIAIGRTVYPADV